MSISKKWFIIYKNSLIHPSKAVYDLSCTKIINPNLSINLQVLKFKEAFPLEDINKVYLDAHIEKIKAQVQECIKYIKDNKDGTNINIIENGYIKIPQRKNTKIDINRIINLYVNNISNNQSNLVKVLDIKSKNENTKSKDKNIKQYRTVGDLMKINDPRVLNKTEYIIWKEIHYEMNNDIDIDSNKNNIYQNDDYDIDIFNDPREFKYSSYHNYKDMIIRDDKDNYLSKNVKIYYIFGPVSVNKLEKVYEIIRLYKEKYSTIVNYINYEDGFWNGKAFHDGFYSGVGFGSKIAIYKDFYEYDIYINRFRDLIDCSRRPIRVRRGWRRNDYELIIITSVQNPKDIYKEYPEEDRRRILESITEIIDLTPKNN